MADEEASAVLRKHNQKSNSGLPGYLKILLATLTIGV